MFEGLDKPGGMPRYGIPSYRLPYERLDADIDVIQSMGVEIRCNTWIGRDISLETLREDYDAVLLALGLQLGRSTRIPGADHDAVVKAVDVLKWVTADDQLRRARAAPSSSAAATWRWMRRAPLRACRNRPMARSRSRSARWRISTTFSPTRRRSGNHARKVSISWTAAARRPALSRTDGWSA